MKRKGYRWGEDTRGVLQFRQDVGDVGLVERREGEALLAEVVEGCL